jgi:hypothetical protein
MMVPTEGRDELVYNICPFASSGPFIPKAKNVRKIVLGMDYIFLALSTIFFVTLLCLISN